ncbi:sulfite exporter TauE/SafE family protein [Paenibacillus humicola]|uniref:sulfite exporter TauE/SafE family protein n=1 Tax=Paenibacillus humicola TaxID=3110540 RepID=UPI00237B6BEB|nr:sulfite exporter TauE/SafE family protein [Paenibacillus humicola]
MTLPIPLFFGLLGGSALLAGLLKNGFGVGAGAFITPILSLFMPPAAAVAMMTPILLITDVDGIRLYWKKWDSALSLRLLPSAAVGTVAGLLWSHAISPDLLKRTIGLLTILFSLYVIFLKNREANSRLDVWDALPVQIGWGLAAGLIGALINAAGIVLTIYFILIKLPKVKYIGTLMLLLTVMDAIKIVYFALVGSIGGSGWLNVVYVLPLVLLGGYIGHKINLRVSPQKFESILFSLIFVSGVALLL